MDDSEISGATFAMKKIMILVLACLLIGCGTSGRPKEVLVPVPTPIQEPPQLKQPFLPIWLLTETDGDEPDKVSRYWAKSLCLQMLYTVQLQCALDAYRIDTEKQCPVDEDSAEEEYQNCLNTVEKD